MPVDQQSVLPAVRGIPWWGAVLVATALTAVGAAIDANSSSNLGSVFNFCYLVGCVVAALAVRRRALFTAATQPPLIAFLVGIITLYGLNSDDASGLRGFILRVLVPIAADFPWMAVTFIVTLVVVVARWYLTRDADGAPGGKRRARPTPTSGSGDTGRSRGDGRSPKGSGTAGRSGADRRKPSTRAEAGRAAVRSDRDADAATADRPRRRRPAAEAKGAAEKSTAVRNSAVRNTDGQNTTDKTAAGRRTAGTAAAGKTAARRSAKGESEGTAGRRATAERGTSARSDDAPRKPTRRPAADRTADAGTAADGTAPAERSARRRTERDTAAGERDGIPRPARRRTERDDSSARGRSAGTAPSRGDRRAAPERPDDAGQSAGTPRTRTTAGQVQRSRAGENLDEAAVSLASAGDGAPRRRAADTPPRRTRPRPAPDSPSANGFDDSDVAYSDAPTASFPSFRSRNRS